jgi:hypothetical protein
MLEVGSFFVFKHRLEKFLKFLKSLYNLSVEIAGFCERDCSGALFCSDFSSVQKKQERKARPIGARPN